MRGVVLFVVEREGEVWGWLAFFFSLWCCWLLLAIYPPLSYAFMLFQSPFKSSCPTYMDRLFSLFALPITFKVLCIAVPCSFSLIYIDIAAK